MTERSATKILIGFGSLLILGGIVAASLYNYRLLRSMEPEAPPVQTAIPAEPQGMTGPTMNTARPIIIDPKNDPLAPVKQVKVTPSPQRVTTEKSPGLLKTYETPMKSPVLVQ